MTAPDPQPQVVPAGEPLRALIVSTSFGGGHHQANDAIDKSLRAEGVNLQAVHTDAITYLNPLERLVTVGTYFFWLKYTPGIYKAFYEFTDRESEPRVITGAFTWMGLGGMIKDVRACSPEVVVNSYPMTASVADATRRRLGVDFLNAMVVTDYRIHHHWARPEAELLMVANEEAREQMLGWRIPPAQVEVTGIPISPLFRELIGADRAALRLKHGLDPELPLILISAGGAGTFRALGRVTTVLSNLGRRVQVLVLAGARTQGVEQLGGATLHHLGFTKDFPELLAASDLVVGKAGGLTVAEATTLGVPMVIHEPIPGQEEHNADYLERHGAAIWTRDLRDLRGAVLRALDASDGAAMGAAGQRISRPDAADRVARALLRRLGRA